MKKIIFILLIINFFIINLFSQEIQISAKLESDTVEYGTPVNLLLYAKIPLIQNIKFPEFDKIIVEEVEIVKKTQIEIEKTATEQIFRQTLTIMAFEDSVFVIPAFEFIIDDKKYYTKELTLTVTQIRMPQRTFAKIDTTQVFRIFDIKKKLPAYFTFDELWEKKKEKTFWQKYKTFIIIGIILFLLTAISLFLFFKNKLKNKPIIKNIIKPQEPLHVIILTKLEELKEKKLCEKDKHKQFYTELVDILRMYLDNRFKINTLERTSNEILFLLQNIKEIETDQYENLRRMFLFADIAKFAKQKPLQNENDLSMQNIIEFVEKTTHEEREEVNSQQSAVVSRQ